MGIRAKFKAENALIFVPDREKIFNQLDFQMLCYKIMKWPGNDMTWKWPIYDRMMVPKKRYKTIISSAGGLSDRIIIRIKNVNFIFLVFMTLFYDILTQQIKKWNNFYLMIQQ